ncbi:MAG: peptide chain release factor 1, partial [Armatimonadota bacterium]
MIAKLAEIEKRFETADAEFNDPATFTDPSALQRLGKFRADLEPIVGTIRDYRRTLEELQGAEGMLNDPEMKELALAEIAPLRTRVAEIEERLKLMLVPK